MKKVLVIIPVFFMIFTGFTFKPESKNINLKCLSAVVIDQDSGRVLISKNGERVLPMASTTKIMTAIVAIENGNLKDTIVVSKKAASIRGSRAGLHAGEKVSLEELLYGLMLRSGNDAAIAIAEYVGGSIEGFSRLMNEKALEIGAYNTSFVTPHGLDSDNHYTTAKDLAKITAYAMQNDFFGKLVSTQNISSGETGNFNRAYTNINKFLRRVENADGVKTGYTGKAGKCLVASVKHNYGRYICVILNSGDRWNDAEKMVKYADANYKFVKVFQKNEPIKRFRVYGGNEGFVTGIVKDDLYLPVLKDETESFKTDIYAASVAISPISEKDILGNIVVTINSDVVAKYKIYSDKQVKRKNFTDTVKHNVSL